VFGGWNDGSFRTASWGQLRILLPAVGIGLVVAGFLVKPLNALLIGETYASTLGLRVRQVRRLILAGMIALSGSVTAFCGPLVFLDIAVPHLCRGMMRTSDHRVLLPAVALTGALIALTGDLIVHLPMRRHIFHLNYVTALIGVPVVVWAVFRSKQWE
jgi:iron complex transport system permease protein